MFEQWYRDYSAKFWKQNIKVTYYQYNISWQFKGLDTIVNQDEFILFLEKAVHTKLTNLLVVALKAKINFLRSTFTASHAIVKKYLQEIIDNPNTKKCYLNYLQMYYGYIIEFISHPLINYFFGNLLAQNRDINEYGTDPEDIYHYQLRELQFKIMKLERDVLRLLKNTKPEHNEFYLEFKAVIEDAEQELYQLKRRTFIRKGDLYD